MRSCEWALFESCSEGPPGQCLSNVRRVTSEAEEAGAEAARGAPEPERAPDPLSMSSLTIKEAHGEAARACKGSWR